MLATPAIAQTVTCPAGHTEDVVDWSALWDSSWDATVGPHTMTTADGVDVTVSFSVSGAGCSNANFTGSGWPGINAGELVMAMDWPNNGCSATMQLDFSVGSAVDVQEVQFTAKDVDGGGTRSWHDEVTFDGSSTVTLGGSLTAVTDGGRANNVSCGRGTTACHATGNWDGPVSSVTFTYTQGPDAPANPGFQVIWLSDVAFCYPDTVPVTLSSFKSSQLGNTITTDWQTVSESFNAGFTLWGEVNGEWVALSDKLVRSKATDSATINNYRQKVSVAGQDYPVTQLGLSSVDTNGTEEFYGPFAVGKKYGEQSLPQAIEWQPIRDAYERRLAAKDYQAVGSRWRKRLSSSFDKTIHDQRAVSMAVQEPGVYRVSYEQLKAAGLDLNGVPYQEVAVSLKGKPVPRDIRGSRKKRFGPGSSIYFYGASPTGEDALYLDSLVYQISRDISLAAEAGRIWHRMPRKADAATIGRKTYRIEKDAFYDELAAGDDPWMMGELFSFGGPVSNRYAFDWPGEPVGDDVRLAIELNSITDFDQIDTDGDGQLDDEHHIQVFINDIAAGNMVADETNDGTVAWTIEAEFSDALLKPGANEIIIQSVGDTGYSFSLVYVDSIEINVSEPIVQDGQAIRFAGEPENGGFKVASDLGNKVSAYAYTEDGNLARARLRKLRDRKAGEKYLLVSGASQPGLEVNYWVATKDGFLSPDGLWITQQDAIRFDQPADYIVVVDPALQGEDLDRFVAYREQNGMDVSVYTVDQIVDQFGHGMKTPQAIADFLQQAHNALGYTHVLLVGGHTYDYRNRLNADVPPVNMIPTFYRRTYNLINYSPTDLPFVDFDNSGSPDAAIGRWPVRSAQELATIIDKTLAYENQGGMADAQKALLIAERKGGGLEDFSSQLERIAGLIGYAAPDGELANWSDIEKIYVDELEASGLNPGNQANQEALRRIKLALDEGQTMTVFAGHGSPTRWSNQNLFNASNIAELNNAENPTQVHTLACYTTYYQSPSTNSLAHQFMFNPAGAVSINGASVLGSISGNEALLKIAVENMMRPGMTMGQSVMLAKQQLVDQDKHADTVITWVTLGDPALMIRQ